MLWYILIFERPASFPSSAYLLHCRSRADWKSIVATTSRRALCHARASPSTFSRIARSEHLHLKPRYARPGSSGNMLASHSSSLSTLSSSTPSPPSSPAAPLPFDPLSSSGLAASSSDQMSAVAGPSPDTCITRCDQCNLSLAHSFPACFLTKMVGGIKRARTDDGEVGAELELPSGRGTKRVEIEVEGGYGMSLHESCAANV